MSEFRPGVTFWLDEMEELARREMNLAARGLVFQYPNPLGNQRPSPRRRRGWFARWWSNWRGVETVDAAGARS